MYIIEVPRYDYRETVNGTKEEAVKRFEEVLWEFDILKDHENLVPADMGIAGGKALESILQEQGFINYGTTGEGLPCLSLLEKGGIKDEN